MTKTSSSGLAVFFLLLFLCFMQRVGAVPVEPDVPEEKRQRWNWMWQPDTEKTIDQTIVDSYGGLKAEKAAEVFRMMVEGVETDGMDMLLTPEQAALLHNTSEGGMSKRRLSRLITLWTDGVAPYDITGLPARYHNMMMEAFREWERDTCVRFVPAQPQHPHRIVFTSTTGCSSYLGMRSDREQPISLGSGCHTKRTYLHELGHALGLVHEHQLPQRDRYIFVDFANVMPDFHEQLRSYPAGLIPDYAQVPYNLRSIMHYGKYAFSISPGYQTIHARDLSQERFMGTSEQLAPSDIQVINLLYSCDRK